MEEAPAQVIPKLVSFLTSSVSAGAQAAGPGRRMTAEKIAAQVPGGPGAGSSGVAGIRTVVLAGEPTNAGPYTIRLSVPAHTRIEAHSHRDERSATVFPAHGSSVTAPASTPRPSSRFRRAAFTPSPPGRMHFAETGAEPVVLHISGYGPTDTKYEASRQ